jgi:hypothetical protein
MTGEPRGGKELVLPPARVIAQSRPRLQEHFASEADRAVLVSTDLFKLPVGILIHQWASTENFDKVVRWLESALLAAQSGLPVKILTDPIREVYNYDRALWGAAALERAPIQWKDIPKEVKGPVYINYHTNTSTYRAQWSSIPGDEPMPHTAVDAIAQLIRAAPPDEFWKANYAACYYPMQGVWLTVIYAVYGHFFAGHVKWGVEVARWESEESETAL